MMLKEVRNQSGFTLVEGLIALMMTGLLLSFSFPSLERIYDYTKVNRAMTVLQGDLHYVRDYNMVQGRNGSKNLLIHADGGGYDLMKGEAVQRTRYFPLGVTMPGRGGTRFSFNPRGNTTRSGTFRVQGHYHSRDLVFSLGSGGFDVR